MDMIGHTTNLQDGRFRCECHVHVVSNKNHAVISAAHGRLVIVNHDAVEALQGTELERFGWLGAGGGIGDGSAYGCAVLVCGHPHGGGCVAGEFLRRIQDGETGDHL